MSEMLLGDLPAWQAARLGPDRWAVEHDGVSLSWGELADRALRRAHALSAAGVRQDDVVALAIPNSNGFYELTFALWRLGATPMAVSARLPPVELEAILQTAGAKLVVSEYPSSVKGARGVPADFGRDHADTTPLESKLAKHWKAITSGGSTGRPKVIVDHNSSRMMVGGPPFARMPVEGVMLNPAPLYHNFPFAMTHMALMQGTSVVGMPKFDAETFLQLVERRRVQWVNLVPTMMSRIARLPEAVRKRYDVSSLETVWHTAAPIPAWLKEFWIDWLGGETIWEMYGGTEGFAITQLNGTEWLAHKGSVGRPVGAEVLIRGEDGEALPVGEVGEIYMRGPTGKTPTYHYVGADSRRLEDGFESFGDYGWVDEDGYLYIADRRTDLILCGGSNVYPAEVEAALMAHPGVETAIVIGLPHPDLGAAPHAIIKAEHGAAPGEAELRDWVEARLLRYKCPRTYEFTTEPLRDEAGKVRRSRLRAERVAEA
jgi:bile acid-coenzyme A ligase